MSDDLVLVADVDREQVRWLWPGRLPLAKVSVLDGPFAETKELLAGFNLVEADSLEDAIRMAEELPWAETGCIEVRAVRDVDAVRARVGATSRQAAA